MRDDDITHYYYKYINIHVYRMYMYINIFVHLLYQFQINQV